MDAPSFSDMRVRKLMYRASRRGTKEMELRLGAFVSARCMRASDAELIILEKLVREHDAALTSFLHGEGALSFCHPLLDEFKRFCPASYKQK